jgi:RNA polymerase sigma-70 factor (ECF subfamily)
LEAPREPQHRRHHSGRRRRTITAARLPDLSCAEHDGGLAAELAFIAALQHLSARQRAVLILRDVLGFSARETAAMLETTPVSVDSALQRAHKTVDTRLPSRTQQQELRLLGDEDLSQLVERYVTAWQRNDVDTIVSMLAEDARMTMPPLPSWYSGRDDVAALLRGLVLSDIKRWHLLPASANGQTALAGYLWDEPAEAFMPYCIYVLTLRGGKIQDITAFVSPEIFPSFGLPQSIAR